MLMEVTPGSRQLVCEPWTLEKLHHKCSIALRFAIDKSTLGLYSSMLNSYITFCKLHHFLVLPTKDTLSYYIVYMCAHIKPDSVDSYLSGICNRLKNFFPNISAICTLMLVSQTLKGCRYLKGSEIHHKLPLSWDDIWHAIATLCPSLDHDDKLFLTILVTGFNGLLQLAELSMPDTKKLQN